jgi:Uma2 family endonuclease
MLTATPAEIIYPESDGKPMAENTKQFEWIVTIKENLEIVFAKNPNVFIAGDLLWYPVEGKNTIRNAPDAMVVFGRPKGHRGSYRQWQEGNIPPQVVFEILSPGNRLGEMSQKQQFYDRYGVQEYYIYDPDRHDLTGWQREGDRLAVIDKMDGWVSPQLGIKFEMTPDTLVIYRPDGEKFLGFLEIEERRQLAEEKAQVAEEKFQVAEEKARLAEEKSVRLAAKLRELGLDPDSL